MLILKNSQMKHCRCLRYAIIDRPKYIYIYISEIRCMICIPVEQSPDQEKTKKFVLVEIEISINNNT